MENEHYSGLISEVLLTRSSSFSASLTCMRIPTDFLLTRGNPGLTHKRRIIPA